MLRSIVKLAAPLAASAVLAACGAGGGESAQQTATPSPSPSPSYPAGFTAHGFAKVVATTKVTPGQAATLTSGEITILIPATAFATPVTFQLLEGDNSYWQTYAPQGQTVIANFAFRAIDDSTNQIVAKFSAPVVFVLNDPQVNAKTLYEDTTPSDPPKVEPNPIAPTSGAAREGA
ncbi:MAG: hypothetical protein ACYDAL_15900 [Candidatus Dormibacteraceae bacterium]